MKNYARPVIEIADQLAEGVYMSMSGDTPNPVDLEDAVDAAMGGEAIEDTDPADLMNTETASGASTQNGAPGSEQDFIPDTVGGSDANEVAAVSLTDDQEPANDSTNTEEVLTENPIGTESSMVINCDSKYMNGVWQEPKEGSWGGQQLGCKDVWGCTGCPADKINGCGLQDANAVNLYFRKMGTLMPEWEASGKLPTDRPYGV